MHLAAMVIISSEDAQQIDNTRRAIAEAIEITDEAFFERRGTPRPQQFAIGGRYAADSPDAEQLELPPELARVKQGIEFEDGERFIEPEKESFFADKIMKPVADLSDEDIGKFDLVLCYRSPSTEQLTEAAAAKTNDERRRALYPGDFAVIVDLYVTTAVDSFLVSAFGADSVVSWKVRFKNA